MRSIFFCGDKHRLQINRSVLRRVDVGKRDISNTTAARIERSETCSIAHSVSCMPRCSVIPCISRYCIKYQAEALKNVEINTM